jgi:amino acid permease
MLPDQMSRMEYIRPRVLISARKRLISAALLALICGGIVALKNPLAALFIALLVFAVTMLLVVIAAYGRHTARWEWWRAGAPGGSDPWSSALGEFSSGTVDTR